ncbi:MAG: hypothetical protein JNM84_20205 [Planctomycetes bacterium]|nr:hypothetical protein [Planctomycetota bacterium]
MSELLSPDGRFLFRRGAQLELELVHVASGRGLLALDAALGDAEVAYFTPDSTQLVLALTRNDRKLVRLPAVIELATGLWFASDPRHAAAPLGDVAELAEVFATARAPRERASEEIPRWELPPEPPAPTRAMPSAAASSESAPAPFEEPLPILDIASSAPSATTTAPEVRTESVPSPSEAPRSEPLPRELATRDGRWRIQWDEATRDARLLRADGAVEIDFAPLHLVAIPAGPAFSRVILDDPRPVPPGGMHTWIEVDLATATFFLDFWREPLSPNYDLDDLAAFLRDARVPPSRGAGGRAEPRSEER